MIHSADEFVRLSTENDPRATWDSADESVWSEVVASYPDMKEWVVHNKTVPISILRDLAADPDSRIRRWVAMKRKNDRLLFEALASDPDEDVRYQVAWNRSIPRELLARLAGDPSAWVAEAAREVLRKAEDGSRPIRAEEPGTPSRAGRSSHTG